MKIHFYTSIARLGNAGDDLNGTEQDFGVSPQIPAESCSTWAAGETLCRDSPSDDAIRCQYLCRRPVPSPGVQQWCGKQIITPSVPLARARGAEHAAGAAAGPASPRECPWLLSLVSSRAGSTQCLQQDFFMQGLAGTERSSPGGIAIPGGAQGQAELSDKGGSLPFCRVKDSVILFLGCPCC